MVNYFIKKDNKIVLQSNQIHETDDVIWVDLIDATSEEKNEVEKLFNIKLFTYQESLEIEFSSKFVEYDNGIGINLNFLNRQDNIYIYEPVSFILCDKILFTERDNPYLTFDEAYKKTLNKKISNANGDDAFMLILDTRIDFLADNIEEITDKIGKISSFLMVSNTTNRNVLIDIAYLQEQTMGIRENTIEIQRILSSLMKSKLFPNEDHEFVHSMQADINSLLEHTTFNFDRIEFLQDMFASLVNMDLNKVMKVFTIITVIFVPPTFIAGLYGMNFTNMPELQTNWGYFYALALMLLSVVISLSIFKYKKWI